MRPSPTRVAAHPRRSPNHHHAPAHFEPIERRVLLDSAPIGVAGLGGDDDRMAVTLVRDNDLVLLAQEDGGDWIRQSFRSWFPEELTPISSVDWRDPKDGRVYVAASTPNALAVALDDDDARFEDFRILTNEIEGAEPIASRITHFTSHDGRVHIAGRTAAGDLVLYAQRDGVDDSGADPFAWEYANISADQLVTQGIETPDFQGDLASYATPWGGLNIVGVDAAGDLIAVWTSPELDGWTVSNLTAVAGTPALAGNVAVAVTPWNAVNIAGTEPGGDLVNTWWAPGVDWQATNLTDEFGGPPVAPGTALANTTPWGGINLGGVTGAGSGAVGDIALWWWVPQFGAEWGVTPDLVPGAEPFSTAGDTSFTSDSGTINILGTNTGGEVLRAFWAPGGAWLQQNLDDIAVTVVDDLDESAGIPDPDLAPLADTWQVDTADSIFDDVDADEDATIFLRSDGVWIAQSGDLDFPGLDSSADRGTWDRVGETVTIFVPDIGRFTATSVEGTDTRFTTEGVELTATARTRLNNTVEDDPDLSDQIALRGGLDAVLDDITHFWTRV